MNRELVTGLAQLSAEKGLPKEVVGDIIARALKRAYGAEENIDVKVVLHGDGIGLLLNANENELLQSQIGGLKGQEVDFVICNNTLTGRDIALDSLYAR